MVKHRHWSAKQVSVLLTIISLIIWSYSIIQAELDIGPLGLIHSFTIHFFIALAFLVIAFGLLLAKHQNVRWLILLQLTIIITSLWLIPFLLETTPLNRYGYQFFADVQYVINNGHFDAGYVMYHSWPAFSVLLTFIIEVLGIDNPLTLMGLWPFFMQFLYLIPLYIIWKHTIGLNDMRGWAFIVIFYLANWVGFDYFSAQSLGFFLLLLLLAIFIKGTEKGLSSLGWQLKVALVVIFGALTITHGLTSLVGLAIILSLSVRYLVTTQFQLSKIKELGFVIVMALLLVAWSVTGASPRLDNIVHTEATEATEATETRVTGLELVYRANLVDRLNDGSEDHIHVVQTRILVSVIWGLLALLGLLLSIRKRGKITSTNLTFLIIAMVAGTSPIWVLPLTTYGGEAFSRAYLPMLLPIAFFGSGILNFRRGVFFLIIIMIAAVPLNLIAHYGNEVERVTPSELAGNEFFYDATTKGYVVGGLDIVKYKFYGKYKLLGPSYIKPSNGYALGLNTQDERIAYMKQRWDQFVFVFNPDELSTYVRLTYGDKAREAEFMDVPEWFSEKRNRLDSSQVYNLVYVNPDFKLYVKDAGR